jgi:SAM-dependent methyltransferase
MKLEASDKSFDLISECPICGSSSINDYFSSPYLESAVEDYMVNYYNLYERKLVLEFRKLLKDQSYINTKCGRCKCLFQRNRPGPNIANILYNKWIPSENSGTHAFERYLMHDVLHHMSEAIKLVSLAQRTTGISSPHKLNTLDYGMGNGAFALSLKACLTNVHGTEYANDRIEFGRLNGIKTLHIDDDLPDSYFHFINTEQVMEHVPNPHEVISRLVRSLTPNGILKISVPFSRSLETGDHAIDWVAPRYSRRSPMPLAPLEHLQFYKKETFNTVATDHSLRIIYIPKLDHIRYSSNSSLRSLARNIGRALFLNRLRNHTIFLKISS